MKNIYLKQRFVNKKLVFFSNEKIRNQCLKQHKVRPNLQIFFFLKKKLDKNIHLTETGVNYFRGIKKWIDDGAKCFITTLYAFHSDSMLSLVKKIFEVIQSGNESNNQKV